jgi:hypothetical protein
LMVCVPRKETYQSYVLGTWGGWQVRFRWMLAWCESSVSFDLFVTVSKRPGSQRVSLLQQFKMYWFFWIDFVRFFTFSVVIFTVSLGLGYLLEWEFCTWSLLPYVEEDVP